MHNNSTNVLRRTHKSAHSDWDEHTAHKFSSSPSSLPALGFLSITYAVICHLLTHKLWELVLQLRNLSTWTSFNWNLFKITRLSCVSISNYYQYLQHDTVHHRQRTRTNCKLLALSSLLKFFTYNELTDHVHRKVIY